MALSVILDRIRDWRNRLAVVPRLIKFGGGKDLTINIDGGYIDAQGQYRSRPDGIVRVKQLTSSNSANATNDDYVATDIHAGATQIQLLGIIAVSAGPAGGRTLSASLLYDLNASVTVNPIGFATLVLQAKQFWIYGGTFAPVATYCTDYAIASFTAANPIILTNDLTPKETTGTCKLRMRMEAAVGGSTFTYYIFYRVVE